MEKQLEILKALLKGKMVYDSDGNALTLFGTPTVMLRGHGESSTFQINHLDQFTLTPHKPLTFERIKKECVSGKHLLVDKHRCRRLYLGFNRSGRVVTDDRCGIGSMQWNEHEIKEWTIEEYREE